MILTPDELDSLVNLIHPSPHTLLGMHPLGAGTGVVVRALLPDAEKVRVEPVHEKNQPAFDLKRLPKTDIFEGLTPAAQRSMPTTWSSPPRMARSAARAILIRFCPPWAMRTCICSARVTSAGFMTNLGRMCG